MKKVFVVSKTHLDLGFTDYAEVIRKKYIDTFIPSAVDLAERVNKPNKKSFVWTTGSWILKEALENGTDEQRQRLVNAIKKGDIVAHAYPFTTHTELLDRDTLDYGLSIVDMIDEIRGRKTVAAKMTDVPGHTRGIVKLLAQHGIKLLHIGVNGASALPEVPDCFLWKSGEHEVVVIYSGDYGGAFKSALVDEVLYFDHTLDNHGAPSPEKVLAKLDKIQNEFPDYEVEAGSLDDYAEIIWEVRDRLPVYEGEIGDTWIHGSASDPYKSAALRELMCLKRKWLADGTMQKGSEEYIGFTDNLLCIAEHTCGMDMKMYFADYEHYLKADFRAARQNDNVVLRHPFRNFPQNILVVLGRLSKKHQNGSYRVIEKSWAEQRNYITKAVSYLNDSHRAEAENALAVLRPSKPYEFANGKNPLDCEISCGKWSLRLNSYGGIGHLTCDGDEVVRENDSPIAEYHSYSHKDYDFWLNHYTRNLKQTQGWAIGDFARPLLKYVKGKYPVGRYQYSVDRSALDDSDINNPKIYVDLKCDKKLCDELGAPRIIQVVYSLSDRGLRIDLSWFGKDANRLTEALYMHLFPATGEFRVRKIDDIINPYDVASMGSRNLHAVYASSLKTGKNSYSIYNYDSPVLSPGRGKILEFDNRLESIEKDGISYVLHNNVWGTNFPLWYEDNACFKFEIKEQSNEV